MQNANTLGDLGDLGQERESDPTQPMAGNPALEQAVIALYKAARCAQILAAGDRIDPGLSRVLITIARLGMARPSEIALDNHVGVSTVSRQVDALMRHGLVAKEADPRDARACTVQLTDSGRGVIEQMLANRARAVAPAMDSWSEEDRERFIGLLVRLADELDARACQAKTVAV